MFKFIAVDLFNCEMFENRMQLIDDIRYGIRTNNIEFKIR
jgi:hypothetical protein